MFPKKVFGSMLVPRVQRPSCSSGSMPLCRIPVGPLLCLLVAGACRPAGAGVVPPAPPPAREPPRSLPLYIGPVRFCVLQEGRLAEVEVEIHRVKGDTVFRGRPLREAFPTGPSYAESASWYQSGQPIRVGGRTYVKFSAPRPVGIEELVPAGTVGEVPLFAQAGDAAPPEILMAPLRPGCQFQPYAVQEGS